MTFEEVPPGAQPTRMTPVASAASRPKPRASSQASSGIMTNWATTPARTGRGRRTTRTKSDGVRVRPIPNIMTPRAQLVPALSGVKVPGRIMAMRKAARMRIGKTVTAVRAERSSPADSGWTSGPAGEDGPGVGSGESGAEGVMTQSYPAPPPRRQTFSQFDRVSARFAESGVGDSIRGGGAPRRPGAAAARFHRSAAGVRDGKWRSGRIVLGRRQPRRR